MNNILADFIQIWHIDSFQKLRLVLFLQQHPNWWGTSQEFACQLHLGNVPLVEQIIRELRMVGLVDGVADRYKLRDNPDVNLSFQCLARAVEDPLERQAVLDRITVSEHSERYLEHAHELYR